MNDISSLSTAFQDIQCQLFPPEGIAAAEKGKEVTFWPKTIKSGSLPHRDCISICDQTPLLFFSVNYIYRGHVQDAGTED